MVEGEPSTFPSHSASPLALMPRKEPWGLPQVVGVCSRGSGELMKALLAVPRITRLPYGYSCNGGAELLSDKAEKIREGGGRDRRGKGGTILFCLWLQDIINLTGRWGEGRSREICKPTFDKP